MATRSRGLVGAGPGEVIVADSTSANLYKVLSAAIAVVNAVGARRQRRRIVSERTNFPTDLYIADTQARAHGLELVLVDAEDLPAYLDDRLAVLMLTHVNYRTGRMHRMAEVTRAAHAAGAVVVWDLAHSAGAVPVDLYGGGAASDAADFAVGCGYKYLNGGPGAPAFVWAHPRHTAWMDRTRLAPAAVGLARSRRAVRVHVGLPACLRHRPLRVRHAADVVAGLAGVRRRYRAGG